MIPLYEISAKPRLPETIRIHPRTTVLSQGEIVLGGSPWRMSRIPDQFRMVIRRLAAGETVPVDELNAKIALELIDRGLALPRYAEEFAGECTIIVPAYENPTQLDKCLKALGKRHIVIVVDDASVNAQSIREVCDRHGAQLLVNTINVGPAGARNRGLAEVTTEFVAFIDSDCIAEASAIDTLLESMNEQRLAIVAPRVMPERAATIIDRFERTDSALDMGATPELVRPGAHLGYVPSAAMVARRAALGDQPFDPNLRTGEDVDAVWRITEAGWLVRFEPSVRVHHASRHSLRELLGRRVEYGLSSRELSRRYPANLVPARVAPSSLLIGTAIAVRKPTLAVLAAVVTAAVVARKVRQLPEPSSLTARLTALSLNSDTRAAGSLLRREWWPVGAACLAFAPKSQVARVGFVLMLAPILADWRSRRSTLDPLTYSALRLLADAAYGTGVIAGAVSSRNSDALRPRLRITRRHTRWSNRKNR